MSIKIALIDNDQAVRVKVDLSQNGQDDLFGTFLRQIKQEMVAGETAYLEIEDSKTDSITYEISQFV
ncbi:hypothetical protein ACFL03_05495 [Thermodesulfobacteriota bacterium]